VVAKLGFIYEVIGASSTRSPQFLMRLRSQEFRE